MFGQFGRTTALRTWQAAGLSLAAGGLAATKGPGAVAAAVALAPMVWALGRLHRHVPSADSTSDLVANVLGFRTGVFTGLVQFVGYLLLAVGFARGPGIAVTMLFAHDAESATTSLWWPVWSVAAAILAAALTYFCRTKVVVSTAAVLAAVGMLVYSYVALAAIARVATGTVPQPTGGVAPQSGIAASTLLITLGLALLGVEAVTTLNARVNSMIRPIGSAIAVIALCAATGWVAVALTSGVAGLAFDESQIVLLASNLFADAGSLWLITGALALGSAALLAITLAAVRVASRLTHQISAHQHVGAVTVVVAAATAMLVVVTTQNWAGAASKLTGVAPLLLLVLYVIAAEANSRLPGSSDAAMALRVFMPTLAVVVVLIPLSYYEFDALSLWPPAIAAAIGAAAALAAFRLSDRAHIRPVT